MEQEKDTDANVAKYDEPESEQRSTSPNLHDTNEPDLHESNAPNLLESNETNSQKSNEPNLQDIFDEPKLQDDLDESNLQDTNEPDLCHIDESNIQDSNEPITEQSGIEKPEEEESELNKDQDVEFEFELKATSSETNLTNREKSHPQIEYRDFKCKKIGDHLKRPVIRPHPMLQKTEPPKFSKSAFTTQKKPRKSLVELGYHPTNSVGRMEQMFKSNRDKQILKMLDQQMYPDTLVKVGNVNFNCHNILLQSYSEFFREHYDEPVIQISDKSISPESFETVYEWMLESIPLIPREPLMALFNAATSLGIEELIKGCWHCMDADLVHLCEDQAILLYLEGRKYNLKYVQNTILQRVSKFFLTFVACKEFLEMSCEEVCTLLSSNNIGVNSELEVLLSAARWVNFDCETRKEHIESLLGCVRFSLMPAWYLLQLQNENLQCKQLEWITLDQKLMENIRKAFMYSVTQQQFGHDSSSFQKWCLDEGIRRPTDRKWIYDKGCRYHHRFNCTHLHVITYSMFEEYLASLLEVGTDYWHCIEWSLGGKKDANCCYDDFKRDGKK